MDNVQINKKPLKDRIFCINSFVLKLIAIITMTLDHIGIFLSFIPGTQEAVSILRLLGRICFPIILFLIIEGAKYTKNQNKYLIRIGIMTAIITVAQLIMQYALRIIAYNIFLQLFLVLLTIILLKNKKIWVKLLSILPLIYVIITTSIYVYQINMSSYFFPSALIPDYFLYGYLMGILMFAFTYTFDNYLKKKSDTIDIPLDEIKEQYNYKLTYNSLICLSVIIIEVIYLFIKYVFPFINLFGVLQQSYSMLACIFIFFYSHSLGIKNKIVQYGFYLYYPVHIAFIYLIFQLISIL